MARRLSILPLLLAACAPPPPAQPIDGAGYVAIDYALPFALERLLPAGIPASDVRERSGCYGYLFEGALYPVRRPDGGQYCL